ncbi:deoxyribodipyrimidine photo-lyase [Algoriphagus sp. 4150]|uniref:cryptochrome/photolyase family protein n=1 Tax=Algoriphagus sp. 4150 TaxID=2817756 RepID=UPI00285F68DC|nr:deoxyribodipyrimidine photo-lyase [Algoriphagus sp. 4150]MDR7132543.1 deoxyribodipyrimidine photo-lyase [Algoriphagus sp. 4150]
MKNVSIFWFRRDLRLDDNHGFYQALKENENVLPLFIFDKNILDKLENKQDARVEFIHGQVSQLHQKLGDHSSSILVRYGNPEAVFKELLDTYQILSVFTNRDYEPYAKNRDEKVARLINLQDIPFRTFKDQLIFEPGEILNGSGEFYKVFTPFSKVWLGMFDPSKLEDFKPVQWKNLMQCNPLEIPSLKEMGFSKSNIAIPSKSADEEIIAHYNETRDFPAKNGTSRLGIHLRFGTISIRKLARKASELNATFLNELIWREFYMMILAFNPQVVDQAFKPAYDRIPWRNNEEEFAAWCEGKTGYPIVDAGMRELNTSGYMHNRVRMVVASFLTKHLLIDWRWGEAYFAEKLLDYELASNNGGWQWAAGTGTDAQPYFRVFNPASQQEKFDKNWKYIKKWIPEINSDKYPKPIVDHKFARQRAIDTYKTALNQ